MTVVLSSTALKAARTVKPVVPKELKTLHILQCIHLYHHEGRLAMVTMADLKEPMVEYISARYDGETWETCVPAKPFTDWLRASQLTKEEKVKGMSEQIELTLDSALQILYIKQGNCRAQFKCIDAQEYPAHPQ